MVLMVLIGAIAGSLATKFISHYIKQKEFLKQEKQILTEIKKGEKVIFWYYQLGSLYSQRGEYDKAIKAFKKIIAIDPKEYNAYFQIGIMYHIKGIFDRRHSKKWFDLAASYADKGMALSPDDSMFHYGLGRLYEELGLLKKALVCYKRAIELQKDDFVVIEGKILNMRKIKRTYKEAYERISGKLHGADPQ